MQHLPVSNPGKEFVYNSAKINSSCKKIINIEILNNIKSTVSKHSLRLCEGNTQLGAFLFFVTLSKQGYALLHTECRPKRSY